MILKYCTIVTLLITVSLCKFQTYNIHYKEDFFMMDKEKQRLKNVNYKLILFGISWCPHSDEALSNLKSVAKKFKKENFLIFNVNW